MASGIPIVDLARLRRLNAPRLYELLGQTATQGPSSLRDASKQLGQFKDPIHECAAAIADACNKVGFFYISNYEYPSLSVQAQLDSSARDFFKLPLDDKQSIDMKKGGRAWRGYFPVGNELTSGKPDLKEGIYFGTELDDADPRVQQGLPMHGANLFPRPPLVPNLRPAVTDYMESCRNLGQLLMGLVAVSVQLPFGYFFGEMTRDPLCLFRIFHYPNEHRIRKLLPDVKITQENASACVDDDAGCWGVGEHTDYGLLTILKQDDIGGLEVKTVANEWVKAPCIPDTLIVNSGDMLEAVTGAFYKSNPHRVRTRRTSDPDAMRLSFPFFFDPGFSAAVHRVPLREELLAEAQARIRAVQATGYTRWDDPSSAVLRLGGSESDNKVVYGDYVLQKVSKVFPQLAHEKL